MKPVLVLALPKKQKIIKREYGIRMMFSYNSNPERFLQKIEPNFTYKNVLERNG
jgi:hypothetical protein